MEVNAKKYKRGGDSTLERLLAESQGKPSAPQSSGGKQFAIVIGMFVAVIVVVIIILFVTGIIGGTSETFIVRTRAEGGYGHMERFQGSSGVPNAPETLYDAARQAGMDIAMR
jgi:hypothetical protein